MLDYIHVFESDSVLKKHIIYHHQFRNIKTTYIEPIYVSTIDFSSTCIITLVKYFKVDIFVESCYFFLSCS